MLTQNVAVRSRRCYSGRPRQLDLRDRASELGSTHLAGAALPHKPSPLTTAEQRIVQRHPEAGVELLLGVPTGQPAAGPNRAEAPAQAG